MDIRKFMETLQNQAKEAEKKEEEVIVNNDDKTVKPRYDRLSRILKDGDLFIFVDSDNIVKVGLATIIKDQYEWFSVLHTDRCLLWGEEFWQLDEPLEKFYVLRATRDFASIPHPESIIIIKNIDIEKGKFYGKFW